MSIKTLSHGLVLLLTALATCAHGADKPFRDKLKDGGEGPAMVVIPAGRFLMGSPANEADRAEWEGPQHWVTVSRFALGQTEVTFDEYDRFARATGRPLPSDHNWGRGSRPVMNVSWRDTSDYAEWLSEQTGQKYRLPSEAEWEYAARAGTTTAFNTGRCISAAQANFDTSRTEPYADCPQTGQDINKTQPVASYPPNAFGLYDMHGNVGELLQDCWFKTYVGAPSDGSAWLDPNNDKCGRVVRGGTWGSYARGLRSASRFGSSGHPDGGGPISFNGFRVARSIQKQSK